MRASTIVYLLAALSTGTSVVALASTPVGTAFTYQGSLQSSGVPANGPYDFQFKLFDDPTAGNQIGSTVTVAGLQVTAGIFTTILDFGAGAFGPTGRWIEIGVRASSGNPPPFTILSPRQPVTPNPVALFSMSSGDNHWTQVGNAIMNGNGGFVGINRTTPVTGAEYFGIQAPVSSGYGGMYVQTNGAAGQPFYGYSTGSAFAWTYLDGPTGNWNVYNGGNQLTVANTGNVGIGTTSPASRLEVDATATDAVSGTSTAPFGNGVFGTGPLCGVQGTPNSATGVGVYGWSHATGGTGIQGSGTGAGGVGVVGDAPTGKGVIGSTNSGYGVYGTAATPGVGYAGFFDGDVHINGTLSKTAGSFKIDHPLDPLNKTLSHSFVESPDMMNIYNGNVTTDGDGRATVQLPSYFEALNQDFRYQLTVIGQFAQAIVEKKIENNAFVIRTDMPDVEVSWQVTGIRHDAWANAHRIVVEEGKPLAQRGTYLNPSVFPMTERTAPDGDATAMAEHARR